MGPWLEGTPNALLQQTGQAKDAAQDAKVNPASAGC
jgi:hypothetical protein